MRRLQASAAVAAVSLGLVIGLAPAGATEVAAATLVCEALLCALLYRGRAHAGVPVTAT
jgi:hypothetical protein